MKKTTLYLSEDVAALLRALSAKTGRPQAELVRDAIADYVTSHRPKRIFLSAGAGDSGRKRKGSIADDEEKLLEGFGED